MKNIFLLSAFLFLLNQSFAQCPGCVVDVPAGLPEDTIYLGPIPNAIVGTYYQEDLSFRMPKTTDPVNANDPSIPAGLTIDEVTINSLSNLPPGIAWEVNQGTFIPADETDGCIRFCGTPFEEGTFEVAVIIDAVVFGISQTATFNLTMVVEPSVSISEGFGMTNAIGCGSVEVDFTNNILSNGNEGVTYNWDFGNGATSNEEFPGSVVYNQPGVYEVQYEAVIDTVGYVLTGLTVTESDCDDIPTFPDFSSAPDMRIRVFSPDLTILFDNDPIDNTFPPVSANGNWVLEDGDYLLEVIDEDSGINGADDDCGTLIFNKFSGPILDIGDFAVELNIFHPVTTVSSVDTVIVYALPLAPVLEADVTSFCNGDSTTLTSSYTTGNAWYFDSELIQGAINPTLIVNQAGAYTASYTSTDGCIALSEELMIEIIPLPPLPAFVPENNLLSLFNTNALPAQYTLQWYQDGVAIPGENGFTYCITVFAAYGLEVVDLETGCSNIFTQDIPYNPNVSCATSVSDLFFASMATQVSPNPAHNFLTLSMEMEEAKNVEISIIDLHGKKELLANAMFISGANQQELNVGHKPSGIYFLEVRVEGHVHVEKVVLY